MMKEICWKTSMLIMYQAKKENDHLFSVMLLSTTIKGMNYIANKSTRLDERVHKEKIVMYFRAHKIDMPVVGIPLIIKY